MNAPWGESKGQARAQRNVVMKWTDLAMTWDAVDVKCAATRDPQVQPYGQRYQQAVKCHLACARSCVGLLSCAPATRVAKSSSDPPRGLGADSPKEARLCGMQNLIDASDSVLLVIDVQEPFLAKLANDAAQRVVARIAWLVEIAKHLAIPVIVTAEDIPRHGGTTGTIANRLPEGTSELNKVVFGIAAQPDIRAAIESTGRRTAVLVGLETDVCVQHSCLGLASLDFRVAVVCDATASPGSGYEMGLDRMRAGGAILVSCKSLFYEWVRNLDVLYSMLEKGQVSPPDGLVL